MEIVTAAAVNYEDLLSKVQTQETQLHILTEILKEKKLLDEHFPKLLEDVKNISNRSHETQIAISQLRYEHIQVKNEWAQLSKKIDRETAALENDQKTLAKQYQKISETQQAVIQNLENSLKKYQALSLKGRIKKRILNLIKPKMGVLHQYNGKPLILPEHYKKIPLIQNPPAISIVTPSFNQANFIEHTIQSVISQAYPKLEYIVQDGGSEDATVQVLSRYHSSLKHWETKKDRGQSNAINLGFQHATGEIMAYLNSDDLLLAGSLHYIADYFTKNPSVDVIYGHRILINECNEEIGRWILPKHDNQAVTWADYIPQETLFWRRRIWDKVGGKIDENFRFAMDWDLILRFIDAGANFVRLPRFLGAFRVHSKQKTSCTINDIGMKEMDYLRARCHGHCVTPTKISDGLRSYRRQHLILDRLYQMGILRY
jgi:glycosyltransferase involved in cell wall biosynthesis